MGGGGGLRRGRGRGKRLHEGVPCFVCWVGVRKQYANGVVDVYQHAFKHEANHKHLPEQAIPYSKQYHPARGLFLLYSQ